jgi:hypothetical protein
MGKKEKINKELKKRFIKYEECSSDSDKSREEKSNNEKKYEKYLKALKELKQSYGSELRTLPGSYYVYGPPGEKGRKGSRGKCGKDGLNGEHGKKGEPGKKGSKGDKGPRGESGRKGSKGHRGHEGWKGEPGKDGMGGINGFAYTYNISALTILAGGFVNFDTDSVSRNIVLPTSGGNLITILNAGTYDISFLVRGTPINVNPADIIAFELVLNSITSIPGTQFTSQQEVSALPSPNGTEIVNGRAIIELTAGSTIQLHNITNNNLSSITLSPSIGPVNVVNAAITILQLA